MPDKRKLNINDLLMSNLFVSSFVFNQFEKSPIIF